MRFRSRVSVLCGTITVLLQLVLTPAAHAGDDYVIYSPRVKQGETELELRGFNTRDANPDINQTGMFGAAIAYSPTSWWKTELYNGPFVYGPSIAGTHYSGWEWENFFQLAPHNAYWADIGFLMAYVRNNQAGLPNTLELGPLLEKETEATLQRLNLIWEKQVGVDLVGKFNFRATYMADYKLEDAFAPGIEAYYRPADNAHQLGPGFSGEIHVGHEKSLEYSSALLYGLNQGAPARTFVFRLSSVF